MRCVFYEVDNVNWNWIHIFCHVVNV